LQVEEAAAAAEREGGSRAVVRVLRTELDKLEEESNDPDALERVQTRLVSQYSNPNTENVLGGLRILAAVCTRGQRRQRRTPCEKRFRERGGGGLREGRGGV
jgi:hypothetical protein